MKLSCLLVVAVDGDKRFRHTGEGVDDTLAHLRTLLTQSYVTFPIT